MKIYKVSQNINNDYDTYSDFVIACESEEVARNKHPSEVVSHQKDGKWYGTYTKNGEEYEQYKEVGWVMPKDLDKVIVEEIGIANEGITGIICSSFHAG